MHSRQNKNVNIIVWDPFETYDPRHPNDYHEYKNWKRQEREERRLEEFRKREDRKRPRESSASEYSSDEHSDDGRRRDRKAREYGNTLICTRAYYRTARFHSPEREEEDMPRGLGAHLPHQMPTEAVGGEVQETRPAIPQANTGEEAYLRRLAMSRGVAPPAPAPAPAPVPAPVQQESAPSVPSTLDVPNFATAMMTFTSAQTTAQSHQAPQDTDMGTLSTGPSSPAEPQYELPSEPSPTVPLVSQAVPAIALPLSTQLTMEEKLKNAAAVAARLSALVKSAPPEPSIVATEAPPGPPESTIPCVASLYDCWVLV